MPASDPITGVSNAVAELTGLARTLVEDKLESAAREEQLRALRSWRDAVESRDPRRLRDRVRELLDDAGAVVAELDDSNVAVVQLPLAYLDALVQSAIAKRAGDRKLDALLAIIGRSGH